MSWIIASAPFWFIGILTFILGVFGIGIVAFTDEAQSAFKSVSDGSVVLICSAMVVGSALPLYIAARLIA